MNERSSYDRTRGRLEEIVAQVKAKDVSLEKSLELYEEALRLGNRCAEMIDRTDFSAVELERAGAREDLNLEDTGEDGGADESVSSEVLDDERADESAQDDEQIDEQADPEDPVD